VGTDVPVEEAKAAWHHMRVWIEDGLKDQKRGAWGWEQIRMTDLGQARRLWLAMAVRCGSGEQEQARKGFRQSEQTVETLPSPTGTRAACPMPTGGGQTNGRPAWRVSEWPGNEKPALSHSRPVRPQTGCPSPGPRETPVTLRLGWLVPIAALLAPHIPPKAALSLSQQAG
jgi:hypothetical protein